MQTTTTAAAGEMKMAGGFGKFHAVRYDATAEVYGALCGAAVFANRAVVESLAHVNCARCAAKLAKGA